MKARVRALLTAAMAVVVWLVATPARAAAPQCDTRGATTFAPAPTLDPPQASIDIGDGNDPCAPDFALDGLRTGTPSPEEVGGASPEATIPARAIVAAPPVTRAPRLFTFTWGERSGVRGSVERPPRG